MRHKKSFNHLGRKNAHRKAMLANMASSLIMHKRIETTTAKAKALKRYIEPLITRSKEDSTHSRRVVFSYLQDKEAVSELFREVGAKVADRPGGYTRIIRLGSRLGDNADMCLIELVDYNENLLSDKGAARKSASRRRRGAKTKAEASKPAAAVTAEAPAEEAVIEEVAEAGQEPEAQAEEAVLEEAVAEEPAVEEPVAEAPVVEEAEVETELGEKPEAQAGDLPAEEEEKDEASDETKDDKKE
jgi:large subunit ribosomal protein L17